MVCTHSAAYGRSTANIIPILSVPKVRGHSVKTQEYVSKEEVREVCRKIGIRDWSKLKEHKVTLGEGKVILKTLKIRGMKIDPEQFRKGLQVELEHGTTFKDANITNNHPLLTGKIVIAHMKETLDYYKRLDIAELEGDLLKALKKRDLKKTTSIYKRLILAKNTLSKSESEDL